MKAEWVDQNNPTSAEDALEKSIGKWRYFSYCTRKQFLERIRHINSRCGLCHWVGMICAKCTFAVAEKTRGNQCPKVYKEAEAIANSLYNDDTTLAEFRTAARKVFRKLKSLRT